MEKRVIPIIITGFFTIFIGFAVRYSYGLLLPEMLPSFNSSKAGAGVVYASYFAAYTLFSPLLGLLTDRYSARFLLVFFVSLLGIGVFLMSISTSIFQASLFFTLVGIGQSACWVPVVTVVQRWVSENRRGAALAIVDLGSASGIVTISFSAPLIVGMYTWRGGWVTLGLIALVVAFMNLIFMKSNPTDEVKHAKLTDKPSPAESDKMNLITLFAKREFWLIGLAYLLVGFCILIPFAFLTSYATEELSIPFNTATRLIGVIAIAGIVGKLTLGFLSDVVGRVNTMMICGTFLVLGGLGMVYSSSFDLLTVSSAVLGIGYGALWPVYAAAARDFFPAQYAGTVIGLWTLLLGLGSIVSPIITGWTIDVTRSYHGAFWLVTISAGLSMVMLMPIAFKRKLD